MDRKSKSFLVVAGLLVVVLLATVVGCQPTPTAVPIEAPSEPTEEEAVPAEAPASAQVISMAGSTTVQPLAEKAADAFSAKYPNVRVDVQGGGSGVGVKSAGQGTVDVGMASREVKEDELAEYPNLKVFVIARDGIAIVVHPDVAADNVALDQVRGIFAGEITNWSEVGGADKPIVVVAREEGSGTRKAFEEIAMGKSAIVDSAILLPSNGAVHTTVSTTPDAVGFISFGYVSDEVKALSVDGIKATVANAAGGTYPIVRPLNLMTDGEPNGVVKDFIDFFLSDDGQAIAEEEGYLKVTGVPQAEEAPAGQTTISMAGSTTVQPLAEKAADAFSAKYPNVQVDVQGGGSGVGVKSAGQGTVDVGMASREVKEDELAEYLNLKVFVIARDGIAIVVHPDVAVDDVTKDQVRGIFAGEITNWSEVGGADKPIVVVAREEGSGTRKAFEEIVMAKSLIADSAILLPSNGAVHTTVSTTPDAVGFISFGYLSDEVKALNVDGVEATVANAAGGTYPIVRPLNLMTDGEPSGVVKAWVDFFFSAEGQQVAVDEGFLSVK